MATAAYRSAPPAAPNFADPKASLQFLLDPNSPLSEVDTAAAEAAIGMGGMLGSPFAANNQMRLRDSERINRLQIGQNLLQPYLNRESGERIANNNIQAQAASDALRESGLNTRLSAEGQQRLQLAILNGDLQAQDRILTEAGLDRRETQRIGAGLQESTQRNQTNLLTSLLPFAFGGKGGGGSGGGAGGRPVRDGTNDISTSWGPTSGANPFTQTGDGGGADVPHWGDPNYAQANAGGDGAGGGSRLSGTLGVTLDKILRSYGLS